MRKMERKIICIVVITLVIFSTFASLHLIEKAKGEEQNPTLSANPLNLTYIWEQTTNLTNVIYEYPPGLIPKGRAYGSWGANFSADMLLTEMNRSIGLETDYQQIQHINSEEYNDNNYTSIINVTDFQFQVYDSTGHYPFSHIVPTNETFVIPQAYPMTNVTDFDNISVVPLNLTNSWNDVLKQLADFEKTIIESFE